MSYETDTGRASSYDYESQRNNAVGVAGDKNLPAAEAALECLKAYSREHPEVAALWIFGIGFVLGWKMRPW